MAGVKLFIEGVADQKFLTDVVLKFFVVKLVDTDFIELGGYTGVDKADVSFKTNADGINLLFLDADYPSTNGGFERRCQETLAKKAVLNIDFELFLFPNNREDGDLEVLLERIINPAHQDIFDCWADYEGCLSARARNYTVPARKTKIYGYMEALLGTSKSQKEKAKEQNRDYLNAAHWNLNNEALTPPPGFLKTLLSMNNRITKLFGIEYPIIQAGMIWCSGWRLAAAVSNAGGLGQIGSGSMYPDILREHIRKCKAATDRPFAVNVPLLYPDIDKHMQIIIEEGVQIVFTSAGSPKTWTKELQGRGIKVVHVTASSLLAKKCEDAGVDAVVAEGFEAGGHNGREETTTLCLIPAVRDAVSIPLIGAGGIASGRAMMAVMALGADGVQIGTRFVCSDESSAHPDYKAKVSSLKEGDTKLSMKKVVPVRLIKNEFYKQIQLAEDKGADASELMQILGRARAKKGMFEGDMTEGELEIGQIAATIRDIKPAGDIVRVIWTEFQNVKERVASF